MGTRQKSWFLTVENITRSFGSRSKRWTINVWRALRTRGKTSRVIRVARVYTYGSRSVLATILQPPVYINSYGAQNIRVVDVTTDSRIARENVIEEEKGYRRSIHFLCTSRLFFTRMLWCESRGYSCRRSCHSTAKRPVKIFINLSGHFWFLVLAIC